MAQFAPLTDGIEVSTEGILSLLYGFGPFKTRAMAIMEKHGLSDIVQGKWYPQKDYLNAFKEIVETSQTAGALTLYQVGLKVPENAIWPPEIQTIEDALASIDVAFHMNHRKNGIPMFNPETGVMLEGIGHYGFDKIGEREVKMVNDNSYPCDFDRGIIKTIAQKFRPKDGFIRITHDDTVPCRSNGGDSCTYYVRW